MQQQRQQPDPVRATSPHDGEKQSTSELLAVRFPHSHHLFSDLEDACSVVKHGGRGFGRICIDTVGLDLAGHLLVKFFDLQIRLSRKGERKSGRSDVK